MGEIEIDVEGMLGRIFRRCEAARFAGGISKEDILNGRLVPPDWQKDDVVDYWLPPNVHLI